MGTSRGTCKRLNSENDEQWWVRVQGREYGPVSRATLREWQSEGRLLPVNEVRSLADGTWTDAAQIPGLFAPPPLPAIAPPNLPARRTVAQLLSESWAIYRRAFLPFFLSTLFVAAPMLALNLTSNSYGIFRATESSGINASNLTALLAFTWLVVAWPLYLASVQLAALAAREQRKVRLLEIWRRAVNFFPRMALLSVLVYGSYFFWCVMPLVVLSGLVGGGLTLLTIFLGVLLLVVPLAMLARLFVNFMFWQQSAMISGLDGPAALRESKLLARSKRRRQGRPLWHGIILASIWGGLILVIGALCELPWALPHFRELATPAQAVDLVQKLNAGSSSLQPVLIAGAVVSSICSALLRPLFAIAFVLLYHEARADFSREELEEVSKTNDI